MYKLLSVRPDHSPGREMCKLNYVCFILIQSHRSVNGQRQGAGLPVPTDVKLQHFKPNFIASCRALAPQLASMTWSISYIYCDKRGKTVF